MANIKFSDFTVGNTEGDIDFVVGYKGASNIQISPTNLLASALGNYLPLAGGTMTGTNGVIFPDSFKLKLGASSDFNVYHSGSHSYLENYTGDIIIQNNSNDKDIIFQSDDGAGGVTNYIQIDGSELRTTFNKTIRLNDAAILQIGNDADLRLYHNGTNSNIENFTGNLQIIQNLDDGDIVFRSDNGSGGTTEYFRLDGSQVETVVFKDFNFEDNVNAKFGSSADLQIKHDGTNSQVLNLTGNLNIKSTATDGDIRFFADNGSGGTTEYFRVDGGSENIQFAKTLFLYDNIFLNIGNAFDLRLYHDGNSNIKAQGAGNLIISQTVDDADIIFSNDDGSGGTGVYFLLDGSLADGSNKFTRFLDRSRVCFGDAADLQIYHDGTTSNIQNNTGNLSIINHTDDGDIKFFCDDGSGGVAEYFRVDGGDEINYFFKDIKFLDNGKIKFGDASDLEIYHNGTDSIIENNGGDLYISNKADDKDIIFRSDNGSGGFTTYFFLDGGDSSANPLTVFPDNARAGFGASGDLQIYHDGSDSYIKDTGTGDLKIQGADITIETAGGNKYFSGAANVAKLYHTNNEKLATTSTGVNVVSGTVAGSTHRLSVGKVGSGIGNQKSILELVENTTGSDMNYGFSFTADGDGGNNLLIRRHNGSTGGATVMTINRSNDNVRFAGNLKVQGVSEYADNTAAIAGGLTTGDLYRTGDLLKIVH